MYQSRKVILPVLLVVRLQHTNHVDKHLIESLTLAISFRMVRHGLHVAYVSQFAQLLNQLRFKVTSLILSNFSGKLLFTLNSFQKAVTITLVDWLEVTAALAHCMKWFIITRTSMSAPVQRFSIVKKSIWTSSRGGVTNNGQSSTLSGLLLNLRHHSQGQT